ncbi:hypothetical protein L1987_78888 [Smallanthus sonchifolius]|uniref:Uncharacterized protein n=1 Tax=Smallanthus sonchifolius TaxID=185202 RepID=A0ACB8ZDW8_9ASTR|nr:hypothetical protein L1987_78888 [Smallanthus sonchifolius]
MSYEQTVNSSIYKEAAKALEQFDSPAIGITKVPGVNTSVKQNNFVIQLLVKLSEKAEDLQEEIRGLKKEVLNLQKAKETKEDFQITVDELTRKLEGVQIGDEKPSKKKGPFYVYEDPLKIFEREKAKSK